MNATTTLAIPRTDSNNAQWMKAVLVTALIMLAWMLAVNPAFAQATGGTGTSTASSSRIIGVVTQWQAIIFGIGAFVLAAAFMYVGYAMAFGGKKWSDVANVAYGAVIAGMGGMLVGWLFS